MAKKKCPECPKIPAWMTTFSDLMSLLLTFFVLLLSMSAIDPIKLEAAFGILSGGIGIFEESSGNEDPTPRPFLKRVSANTEESQRDAEKSIKEYIDAQNLQQMVSLIQTNKGFTVRVLDSIFFKSGSSELLADAYPVLDQIASIAKDSPFYIQIEGHTDDTPSGQFALYNWDLSTNRALSVLKYFITYGVPPERLSTTGFGEYHPLYPNISAENRAKNRRVEINFITPEFYESNKSIGE